MFAVQFRRQIGQQLLILCQCQRLVRTDNQDEVVSGGPIVLHEAEGFAEKSFDAIAADGGPHAARNGQSQASPWQRIGFGESRQRAQRFAHAGVVDRRERQ